MTQITIEVSDANESIPARRERLQREIEERQRELEGLPSEDLRDNEGHLIARLDAVFLYPGSRYDRASTQKLVNWLAAHGIKAEGE